MSDLINMRRDGPACTRCHAASGKSARLVRGDGCTERVGCRTEDGSLNCMTGRWMKKSGKRPDIMLIGEAPGAEEEERGEAFVGRSGRLLQSMLLSAGFRDRAYLDNIVRCRPAHGDLGRHTTQNVNKMRDRCAPYVLHEVQRLRPWVLVLLGNVPLRAMLGVSGIGRWEYREIISRDYNCIVVPAPHPASILRETTFRIDREEQFIESLKRLKRHVGKPLKFSEPSTVFVDTVREFDAMLVMLEKRDHITADFETVTLDARTGKTICLALCGGSVGYCVALMRHDGKRWSGEEARLWLKSNGKYAEDPARFRKLKRLLESRTVVMHNAAFDLQWFRRIGWDVRRAHCTMIANGIMDDTPNGLKDLALLYSDMGSYEDPLAEWLPGGRGKSTYDNVPVPVLSRYAGLDAVLTESIRAGQIEVLKSDPVADAVSWQMDLVLTTNDMRADGVLLDLDHMRALRKKYRASRTRLEKRLHEVLGPINLNSNKDLGDRLYRRKFFSGPDLAGLRFKSSARRVGWINYGTRENVMSVIARNVRGDPVKTRFIDDFVRWRKLGKLLGTYIDPFLESGADRLHPNYNQIGTRTGRPSMSEPNLLNIPREDEMRSMIRAAPGSMLVEADHSQIEVRMAAEYSGDAALIGIYESGGDVHSYTGSRTMTDSRGRPLSAELFVTSKEWRARAKAVVFSIIFGVTDYTLAERLGCMEEEAGAVIDRFKNEAYPDLGDWIREREREVVTRGYVTTLFGRRINVAGWRSSEPAVIAGAERRAVNYPIQSAAADVTAHSIMRVRKRFKKEKFPVGYRLTVYDSLLVEVRTDLVPECAAIMREEMEKPPPQVRRVPLKIDVSAGPNWGALKSLTD